MKKKSDIFVNDCGSIILVTPQTKKASRWIKQNVVGEVQWHGGGLAVEPRYAVDLLTGMRDDGLRLER